GPVRRHSDTLVAADDVGHCHDDPHHLRYRWCSDHWLRRDSLVGDVMTLNVNEIFGITIQGEGPSMGRPCAFVRLFQCNLQCTWCDTPYTWAVTERKAQRHRDKLQYDRAEQSHGMHPDQIAEKLEAMPWATGRLPM